MAELLFPLQFKRQYSGPIDPDMVFATSAARVAYLTDPLRYAGQIVSCLQTSAVYVLNGSMTAWTALGSGSGSTNISSLTGATQGLIAVGTSAGSLSTDASITVYQNSTMNQLEIYTEQASDQSRYVVDHINLDSTGMGDAVAVTYIDATADSVGGQNRIGYMTDNGDDFYAGLSFTSASPNLEINRGINIPSGDSYNINGIPHTHSGFLTSASTVTQSQVTSSTGWISSALSGKEPSLSSGTSAQYYRGDKTWQSLNTRALSDVLSSAASNRQSLVYTSATSKYTPMNISNIAGAAQNASTGAVYFPVGLSINATSATKFDVGRVDGFFVDNTSDHDNPSVIYKEFDPQVGITATYLASSNLTYVAIDINGTVIQSPTAYTPQQHRQYIVLGILVHTSRTAITVVNNAPHIAASPMNQFSDLTDAIGNFNVSGNIYSANGANLFLNKNAGVIFKAGSNFVNDVNNPNILSIGSSTAPSTMRYHLRDGTEYANTQSIDPLYWDNAGVRTLITGNLNNNFSIQRIYLTQSGLTRIQYGQALYNSMSNAIAAISTEIYVPDPLLAENGILRGLLIVRANATTLNSSTQATFLNVGKFGGTQELGSIATTDLQTAYNNSTTPEITTNATLGAVSFKVGPDQPNTSAAIEIMNTSGTVTSYIDGNGMVVGTSFNISAVPSSATSASTILTRDASGNVSYISDGTSATFLRGDKTWQSLSASDITSGIFNTARLGSGSATSGTYLRGDGTWVAVTDTDVVKRTGTFNTTAIAGYVDISYTALPNGYPFSLQFYKDNETISFAATNITATGFRAPWNAMPAPITVTYVVIG